MRESAARRRLIVYARSPLPGRVKSRLAAGIGKRAAAGVYARLLYTLLLELTAAELPGTDLEISLAAADDALYFARAFPEFDVHPQRAGDLGQRLSTSFEAAFTGGAEQVVVVASDTPALGADLVAEAFAALEHAPAVVGPCRDGGYYLLGMQAPGADLFAGVAWSTGQVLAQTEALARAQGLRLARLPERFDVDTAEDLRRWELDDRSLDF